MTYLDLDCQFRAHRLPLIVYYQVLMYCHNVVLNGAGSMFGLAAMVYTLPFSVATYSYRP